MLALCLVVVSLPQIKVANAQGTIYIREDGSVKGTDKIQRDENGYTFTENIFGPIVIEKNNVAIYGAGFILEGDGSGRGLDFSDSTTNITVKNLQISNFDFGIHFSNCSHTLIESNYLLNNFEGIRINGGFNNTLSKNRIENNSNNGISVFFNTRHNLISENTIINNWVGILVHLYSEDNTLSKNVITKNRGIGIWLDGGSNNRIIQNNVTDNTK
jgi:parallel beta-helix repeat protein